MKTKLLAVAGAFILMLFILIMQRIKINHIERDLRHERSKSDVIVYKDRLINDTRLSDSLKKVINDFTADTIYINKIRIKYDTVTKRVVDSSYIYQLEWYITELNLLYNDK